MKVIDLEAHFYTDDYVKYLRSRKEVPREEVLETHIRQNFAPGVTLPASFQLEEKLLDLGSIRIAEMDAAGIDIQVLSLSAPGCEQFEPSEGTEMAKKTNDVMAKAVKAYPDRFIGFAALAPQDPDAAARELERTVKEFGFRGAKINSHIRGEYMDDEKYWPVFETAEKLGVPIYLHPTFPSPSILKPYADYDFSLAGPVLGFGAETSLHAMRLIYSGVFDKYPGLKIILGHLGEALPFWLFRIDFMWIKPWVDQKLRPQTTQKPSYYVSNNFLFTSSGMHYMPAFICAYMAVGGDMLSFGADYPYEDSKESVDALQTLPICEADTEKFFHGNAEKVLGIT